MPPSPKRQLFLLIICILSGFLSGIFYDFLRSLRRRCRSKTVSHLLDALFCLVCFTALFLIGYTAGDGMQRFYAVFFSLFGSGLYFYGLSPVFLSLFETAVNLLAQILNFILTPLRFAKKRTKKIIIFSKNFFYSGKKCYTMECTRKNALMQSSDPLHPMKGTEDETEKGRYYY